MLFKKNKSILFILLFIGLILPLSFNFLVDFSENPFSKEDQSEFVNRDFEIPRSNYISDSYPTNETVAIIINMSLKISSAMNTYENDLKATGYNVLKYHANITNAKTLKNLLKGYYEN